MLPQRSWYSPAELTVASQGRLVTSNTHRGESGISALIHRLSEHSLLSGDDIKSIRELVGEVSLCAPGRVLSRGSEAASHLTLLLEGTACRFAEDTEGRCQITALYYAGDICNINAVAGSLGPDSIRALSGATILSIPADAMRSLAAQRPSIGLALWREAALSARITEKLLENIGIKSTAGRIAHLICETAVRMERAGSGDRSSFAWHLTQEQLGWCAGVTSVHVNRVLQELRREGWVVNDQKQWSILNWQRLASLGEFDDRYLRIHTEEAPTR